MTRPLKTIEYRGGVVVFEIPADWREEYEPRGGGTFYEDRPDSGTLRLNVLSFETKDGRRSEEVVPTLFAKEPHEVLPSGFPMRKYSKDAEEKGEAIRIYRWEVAVPIPPSGWNLACFTHTIVVGQESDPRIRDELELVDQIARTARFATRRGEIGDHYHEKK